MKELITTAEKIATQLVARKQTIAVAGILNRRPDLGGAAVGAGRIGLFPRRRRGLHARCAAC